MGSHQEQYHHDESRWLAGDDAVRIDYNILSVAAMTLALILFVEVIRHKLDHASAQRPFFHAVLEGVYAELATLGIVEFFLHLMAEYYPDYDKSRKAAFADVHFLLFYTAILNAFQSVIMAVVTTRVSRKIWIETEMLELNHYVEIREEFQRVQKSLTELSERSIKNSIPETDAKQQCERSLSDPEAGTCTPESSNRLMHSESLYAWGQLNASTLLKTLHDRIRYPRLQKKYDALLSQIRFHELRVHFLQAYDLPLKLKISDYLIRSEQTVLIKLVHVSSLAWILLTGAVIFVYYVLGMIFYYNQSQILIGRCLMWIFFWSMAVFVLVSAMVWRKMTWIFHTIMHEKTLWDVQNTDLEQKQRLSKQQLALFWNGTPKNVISAIQFMQFGYAVAISTLIIFWEEINDGGIAMQWYLFAVVSCYAVFVQVIAQSLPKYTQCTSLGQLVDEQRLRETVALFRLDEAKQKQAELLEFVNHDNDFLFKETLDQLEKETSVTTSGNEGGDVISDELVSTRKSAVSEQHSLRFKTENAVNAQLGDIALDSSILNPSLDLNTFSSSKVRIDARQRKRNRRKVVSDGVATMAAMDEGRGNSEDVADRFVRRTLDELDFRASTCGMVNGSETAVATNEIDSAHSRRQNRRHRQKSMSDGVAFMANLNRIEDHGGQTKKANLANYLLAPNAQLSRQTNKVHTGDLMAELVKLDTDSLRQTLPQHEQIRLHQRDGAKQKKRRQKVLSDGVASMASISSAAGKALGMGNQVPTSVVRDDAGIGWKSSDGILGKGISNESETPLNRRLRMKALSDGVAAMAVMKDGENQAVVSSDKTRHDFTKNNTCGPTKEDSCCVADTGNYAPDNHDSLDLKLIEESSVKSTSSNDGFSDADDVPDTALSFSAKQATVDASVPFRLRLYGYFLSTRQILLSNVFGTIVAFFLVGQRVESFLHSESFISEEFVALYTHHTISFWVLFTWLAFFVIASFTVVFLALNIGDFSKVKEMEIFIAAIIDAIISLVCIVVLCIAEMKRCCRNDITTRLMAEVIEDYDAQVRAPCSCRMFGSREYGGLGSIEPFTSLICLRAFRHTAAKYVAGAYLRKWQKGPCKDTKSGSSSIQKTGIHTQHLGQNKSISIAEVWEATIGKYPELVAQHGEFSGEILRAMLGVHLLDSRPSSEQSLLMPAVVSFSGAAGQDVQFKAKPTLTKSKSFSLGKEYSGLSSKAQEAILAGKLGCSVVLSSRQVTMGPLQRLPSVIPEDDYEKTEKVKTNQSPNMLFEKTNLPASNDSLMFTSPNARLIRSMRRCDRKLLPILDKWTAVDVAMTRFEMVYFDATDADETVFDSKGKGIRQAIIFTKGGKGLRLCDVAEGRRVVGHLALEDCMELHVERLLPRLNVAETIDLPEVELEQTEFWQKPPCRPKDSEFRDTHHRGALWSTIKQDVLTIHTSSSHTLKLRFYADFEFAKTHCSVLEGEDEFFGNIHKNNAFQWVQTIGRFCGPEQLKQELAHFGADNSEELRDYLLLIPGFNSQSEAKGHLRSLSRVKTMKPHRRTHSRSFSVDASALSHFRLDRQTRETQHDENFQNRGAVLDSNVAYPVSLKDIRHNMGFDEGTGTPRQQSHPAQVTRKSYQKTVSFSDF